MPSSDSKQTQQTSQSTNPWAVQAPYLTQGFEQASQALQGAQNTAAPSGFVAQFTPDQLGVFQQMLRYGQNGGISQQTADAAGRLTGAGTDAASGGLTALANYKPATSSQSVLSDANTFANNPAISDMVDAATRDARRAVYENALPAVDRNAAATGNLNSSKSEIAKGIIERGLAEKTLDASANLRGDAFNRGLSTATNIAQGNDQNALQALLSRVSGGTNAAQTGIGGGSSAINQQSSLFDLANQGGAGQREAAQAALDEQLKKYGFGANSQFDLLDRYWNIVGGKNWGGSSSGTQTTTNQPSEMAKIGQWIGLAGSLF